MSKKKQPPRMPVKKEPEIVKLPEKKPIKGIIIAAAAIILVAAIVLVGVFVVKPSIDNSETTTAPQDTNNVSQIKDEYTFVDYKGASLPQEFVDILNQAELDSKAACKEYGTALEIGDIKISMPEFVAYYYDQYSLKKQDVQNSIDLKGMNITGYDPLILPDKQEYVDGSRTWAEEFTKDAISMLQEDYEGFNKAIEAKTELTNDEITQLISEYERINMYSEIQHKTLDVMFAEVYCEGFTEAMFKAREIRLAYKQMYREYAEKKLSESYSDSMLEEKLSESMDTYTVVCGRIYPIEGEYNAVEVSKINTEQEFIDYANKNYPNEGYVAETVTLCNYLTKDTISSTYGPEVGDWMFSEERVPGEIAVVEGQLFKYLVYIEELPYLSVSRKIMYCGYDYFEGITEQEIESYRNEMQTEYDNWVAGGAKKEEFAELCLTFFDEAEVDTRVGDFFYVFDEWIFDEARKPGDHTLIETDAGCCIFYYIDENEDDFDWKENMKADLSSNDFLEAFNADIEENYKVKRKESVITKAQERAHVTITRKIEEEKEDD